VVKLAAPSNAEMIPHRRKTTQMECFSCEGIKWLCNLGEVGHDMKLFQETDTGISNYFE